MQHRTKNIHWLWLSLCVILFDHGSKYLVERHIARFDSVPLLPHLNLANMHNTGAAFSMFNSAPAALFILLSAMVSGWILWWLRKHPYDHRLEASAFALILGGALGNAIDRSLRGFVVDFVDFYIGNWHFAAFNMADSAISIGAALLVLDMLIAARHAKQLKAPGAAAATETAAETAVADSPEQKS
ncbi:MAG: lipoprotein signal peptidase [Nevskia sp.]|nr:lipoprotein signal peptidase [Nevskia sp.]